MVKHYYTETTQVNFSKLEERLLQINKNINFANYFDIFLTKDSTLIMATGGSKTAAYYLQMLLEKNGTICEVIEPRDYFYKNNINSYKRLIIISNSGTSNGMIDALKTFEGETILITAEYKNINDENNSFKTIYWSNEDYLNNKEKSFISLATTLGPMLVFLETNILLENEKKELSEKDYEKINNKLIKLIKRSKENVDQINFDFKDANLLQVLSGYDTKAAACVLESNLIETGSLSVVIHDKGAYCHGRSNLLFHNPESPIIYLAHDLKNLDNIMIGLLKQEYQNIFLFDSFDEKDELWNEFYLILQMYFLSLKVATHKGIDFTMPEYNENIVKRLFTYRGEM